MNEQFRENIRESVTAFHLPRYRELPDMGLFLEQVVRYVNRYMAICSENEITSSMVSNYVKHKIIPGPKKKSYEVDSIACLIFVAFAKMVMPMDDIRFLFELQQKGYDLAKAYDYFCDEFERLLKTAYGFEASKEKGVEAGEDTEAKVLLHTALFAITNKICLDQYISYVRETEALKNN